MNLSIPVAFKQTRNATIALQYLKEISIFPTIAWDFEVAIRYSAEQLAQWKALLEADTLSLEDRIHFQSCVDADALGHPSHCTITHCSIAVSPSESYVFILDNSAIARAVLSYLINSPQKQILHNAGYDFRHLMYHTDRIPADFEDTQILAKCLINHVNTFHAKTGLKELAGRWYGDWGISSECFTIAQMYDPKVIRYAAIDSCATYQLWSYLNAQCDEIEAQQTTPASLPEEAPY